ncbi:MAG: LD-carboxypeptidase [Flavobacteriales bacterium]|nr:LD-carboxypeptidase [Flavobacteriales bacterium]|tara:strand:- start:3421 stop:4332 length:912 start_codon:yes stop_codon:yes gene_type:complete
MNKEQTSLHIPTYLKEGNKIGLISTARKISKNELQGAIESIKSWGLEVVLGQNLFNNYHQFSGRDDERAKDLQAMLDNPEVKAILVVRGGYGTVRIIDHIDFSKFQKNPKWLAGYSDITVLHSQIHKLKVASLHSTMPINFSTNTSESIKSLKDALFGKKLSININYNSLNRFGEVKGQIVGGNLSILYSLIGSPSDLNTDGKILFIEDLDEYLYHIDRMMMNLKRSGKLSNLKGLIVGGMTKMNDNTIPFGKDAESIIKDAVSEYSYPVCFGFPAGHIKDNRALKLGVIAELKVDKQSRLNY